MVDPNISVIVNFEAPVVPFDPSFNLMATDAEGSPKRAEGSSLMPGDGTVTFEKLATEVLATPSELDAGTSDKIAAGHVIRDFLTKRQKHDVRDYGSTIFLNSPNPSTVGFQAACTEASDGYPLHLVPGEIRLDGPITVGESFALAGPRAPGLYDPNGASWIHLDHLGKGITCTSHMSSTTIERVGFRRTQPTVVAGSPWAPNACDWDVYIDGQDVLIRDNMFLNPTKGLNLSALGRLHAFNNKSHAFDQALEIRAAYDRIYVDTWHQWPFWSQSEEVHSYTSTNLRSFRSLRNDNPTFNNLFSIWHKVAMSFGYFAGDGPYLPAGVTSKFYAGGCCFDNGNTSVRTEPGADGVNGAFFGMIGNGDDPVTNAPLVEFEASNTNIQFVAPTWGSAGRGFVKHSGTGSTTRIVSPTAAYFDQYPGATDAAFDAGDASNRIIIEGREVTPTALTFAGDVRWDDGPWRVYPSVLANSNGAYVSASVDVYYHKGMRRGKIDININVFDIGTANGFTSVTLPFPSVGNAVGCWSEFVATGACGFIRINPGSNVATFVKSDGSATPFPNGSIVQGAFDFEIDA